MSGTTTQSSPFPWRAIDGGLMLRIKAQPGARRSGFAGCIATEQGSALRVMVTEAPERGRANRAVVTLLARALGVPKSAITVVHGGSARLKTLRIEAKGAELERLQERLAQLVRKVK